MQPEKKFFYASLMKMQEKVRNVTEENFQNRFLCSFSLPRSVLAAKDAHVVLTVTQKSKTKTHRSLTSRQSSSSSGHYTCRFRHSALFVSLREKALSQSASAQEDTRGDSEARTELFKARALSSSSSSQERTLSFNDRSAPPTSAVSGGGDGGGGGGGGGGSGGGVMTELPFSGEA
jgi:Ca2+-dependent lipid-binding protein